MRKTVVLGMALVIAGLTGSAGAQTVVSGDISVDTVWGDTPGECPIILDGPVTVSDGVTAVSGNGLADGDEVKTVLTILPGCVVRGQPRLGPTPATDAPGSLTITQTGSLVAVGEPTPSGVIIFTTAAIDNDGDDLPDRDGTGELVPWSPGDAFWDDTPTTAPRAPLLVDGTSAVSLWGGLILLGNAPVNVGDTCPEPGIEGKCNVEGLAIPGVVDPQNAVFGGNEPHDSSGRIRYISVRHGGDEIGTGNEINGVTLGGVGDGTECSFIEVYANFDDGMEWFGGTVNCDHLAITLVGDDSLDTDTGYTGVNQFAFLISPWFGEDGTGLEYGSGSGDKLGEWDGDNAGDTGGASINNRPTSDVWMWNISGIGGAQPCQPGGCDYFVADTGSNKVGVAGNDGVEMRHGFGGALVNSVIIDTTGKTYDVTVGSEGNFPGFDVDVCGQDSDGVGICRIDRCEVQSFASTFVGGTGLGAEEMAALACGDDDRRTGCPGAGCNVVDPTSGWPGLVNADTSFAPTGNASGKLDASLKSSRIDPRIATGGFVGVAGGLDPVEGAEHLDLGATYRGAFASGAPLWTDGWTVLSIAGLL
jgi:hypothetical protein